MIHNTYTSSIFSLRTSFSINIYSNETCPSNCCSCCCSFPLISPRLILPINPSFLYGLRQSTLIHCPPSRRLIYRAPIYDVGRYCCVESCCVKQDRVDRKEKNVNVNKKIRGRIKRGNYRCNALGDAEAMLSLLAENSIEECLQVREQRRRMAKEGKVVRERKIVVCEKVNDRRDRKENVGHLCLENEETKLLMDRGGVRYGEEGHKRREKVENVSNGEEWKSRRRESSSSYYSLSDSGDFESDGEVELKHEGFAGELSMSHGKDSKKVGSVVISEAKENESKRYEEERDQRLKVSSVLDHSRVGSSVEWDCRKKSEKKLAEELAEETKSKKDSFHESSSSKVSSSKKHLNSDERESTLGVNSHWQSWSQIKTNDQDSAYSKSSSRNEQLIQTNINDGGTSTWRRSNVGEGVMIVGKSDQQTGCEYCKECGSIMREKKTRTETQQHAEVSDHRDDARWAVARQRQSENRLRKQEKSSGSLESSVEGTKQHQQMIHVTGGQVNTGRKSQYYNEMVRGDDRYDESTLRSRRRSETRMKSLGEHSTSVLSGQEVKGMREESGGKLIKETEARKVSQTGLSASQVDSSNMNIGSQSASEQRIYDEQAFLTSRLESVEEAVKKHNQIGERMLQSTHKTEVQGHVRQAEFTGTSSGEATGNRPSVTLISQTGVQQLSKVEGKRNIHSTNMEIGSESSSEQRKYDEQASLTSRMKSVEEAVEKHKQIEEIMLQSTHGCNTEVQGHIRQARFAGSPSGEATGTQPSLTVISKTGVQQLSKVEGTSNVHISVVAPSYQYIEGSQYGQPSAGVVRNDSDKVAENVGTGGAYVHPQMEIASSSYDAHGSGSLSYEGSSPNDALGSVARMEETSRQIVGEFVEKMRRETSTSETRMEKTSSRLDSNNEDDKHVLKGSTQSDDAETRLQTQRSRQSSGGSGTKGPSYEMWDVKDHFPQAPSEMESLEGATSEDTVSRRTGKSLWNVVAGVFRFRWGSHSETQKSPVKTGGQNSSNESASGETWFSGNEHDEANSDSLRTEQSNVPERSTSDKLTLQKDATTSGKEGLGATSSSEVTKLVEKDESSSSSILLTGSLSGSVSAEASTNLNVMQQTPQPTPSSELLIPPARQLRRSDAFEEIEEASQNKGVISSPREHKEHAVNVRQSSGSSSEVSDVELKRRKLQRSKQVHQERYEAWEDAYKREYEQRKVDEIFMREALVEAKKASDAWEVPVGAVLVQNGKIIARGYNLVEELRDSTAHGEMICIREASSTLKTWRLSETALYVTLEPCPMCAGAILQARIGTVVWGAPNKLLGADGSWIRLFPEGAEGEQRLEVTDKPAAPIHPFHPKMKIRRGVLEAECAGIMQQFFQLRRKKEKKSEESAQPSCLPVPHHPSRLFHKMHDAFHFLFCL